MVTKKYLLMTFQVNDIRVNVNKEIFDYDFTGKLETDKSIYSHIQLPQYNSTNKHLSLKK